MLRDAFGGYDLHDAVVCFLAVSYERFLESNRFSPDGDKGVRPLYHGAGAFLRQRCSRSYFT